MTVRVQIPVYTDRWMMGDRYGEVVKTSSKMLPVYGKPELRKLQMVADVKLDISGKTIKVLLDDCQWVSS